MTSLPVYFLHQWTSLYMTSARVYAGSGFCFYSVLHTLLGSHIECNNCRWHALQWITIHVLWRAFLSRKSLLESRKLAESDSGIFFCHCMVFILSYILVSCLGSGCQNYLIQKKKRDLQPSWALMHKTNHLQTNGTWQNCDHFKNKFNKFRRVSIHDWQDLNTFGRCRLCLELLLRLCCIKRVKPPRGVEWSLSRCGWRRITRPTDQYLILYECSNYS